LRAIEKSRTNATEPTRLIPPECRSSHRRPCFAAFGLAALLLVPACGNKEPPVEPTTGSTPQRPIPPLPRGKYESVLDIYNIGYGPDGPVYGHEHVTFGGNEVIWDYSDVRERSTLRRTDEGFEAVFLGRTVLGRYDADTGELLWDGKLFRKEH
jgi:hypothetical protein